MSNYDVELKKNSKRNEKFINAFEQWLNEKKLSPKTIRKHLCNADLYINAYLTYYDVVKMEDGADEVFMFLDDWFIRKCAWSSKYAIKEMAASIKKFYQCMSELGYVAVDEYKVLCGIIKESMETFLEDMDEYESENFGFFW